MEIRTGDGTETRYLNFSYLPREDEGVVTGILVLGTDVTEQVEARRQARRSETILSRTLETMAEGIMLADAEGTFRFLNAAAARMLDRDAGDIVGTRYSTLAQLKRLNVDALKIDRSFVRSLTEDRRDRAIVEATLVLGRAMGLRVVAEGIETEEQLALLREMGCREGQGFGLARPMDRETFARWLAEDPEI